MKYAVILDRDGVINKDSDEYIKSPDEFHPIEGSVRAIARLKKAGFTVAVATNQSGVARGLFDLETLEAMHRLLASYLEAEDTAIDGLEFCPHGPDDDCPCRKPRPGMIHRLQEGLDLDLQNTWFIGDSYRDIQAARAAGVTPLLVRTGKGSRTVDRYGPELQDVAVFDNLAQAASHLIQKFAKK